MLILPSDLETIIRNAGKSVYPNECCGFLIGKVDGAGVKTARQAESIRNSSAAAEQYHRFLITPEDMMEAERAAMSAKLDVIGFYHSHPDHPAVPSEFDKNHALPFYSYIILSVEKGVPKEITSWELTTDRTKFVQEKLVHRQ